MKSIRKHKELKPGQIESFNPVKVEFDDLLNLRHQANLLSSYIGKIKAKQSGNFISGFKGRGMQFEEVRPYVAGDDIRTLDWKVTARTNKPHTKLFQEERERPVQICLDLRRAMFFATKVCLKSVWASHASALLSWASFIQKDRVGGLVFSENFHQELKPQLGSKAVLRYLKVISENADPDLHTGSAKQETSEESLFYAILRLRRLTKPGSRLFIISDFRDWTDKHDSMLLQLSHHNEIALLFCYDRFEKLLPDTGHYAVSDGSDEVEFDAFNRQFRSNYQSRFVKRFNKIKQLSQYTNINFYECPTEVAVFQLLSEVVAASFH